MTENMNPGKSLPGTVPGGRPPARLMLVDDHPIVREGLEIRLNQEPGLLVCGTAADAAQAMALVGSLKPDLVITDLSLEGKPGLELIKDLLHAWPDLPIIVLSIHDEMLWADRVLRAGARGYVMKSQATGQIVHAIHDVLEGGIWVSARMNAILLQKLAKGPGQRPGSPIDQLTDREMGIFHMIGQGMGPTEIAAKLFLSVKTVEVHREHIKAKLGLKNTGELIRYATTHLLDGK